MKTIKLFLIRLWIEIIELHLDLKPRKGILVSISKSKKPNRPMRS